MSFAPAKSLVAGEAQYFLCKSLEDTREVAKAFAQKLKPGDVVALYGELGAGKTTMIRMFAQALGYDGVVSSPTFTLMNIYETASASLYHFDFYRINNEFEAFGIGAQEFFESDGIVFIEWPEKAPGLLPEHYYEVNIAIPDYSASPAMREVTIRKVE
jgi:tRNA threonylcarbamoyladenosine biosynthesis protein TsaE